jgi:hypothetical protein
MKSNVTFFDRKILGLLAVIVLAGVAMATWGPSETLDAKFYFSNAEAQALFQRATAHDLQAYRVNELIDLVFLVSYSCVLFLGLRKVDSTSTLIPLLGFVPGVFDLCETSAIFYALSTSTNQDFFKWLGVVTSLKWSTAAIALATLVWAYRKKRREPRDAVTT